METFEAIKNILVENLDVDESAVTGDATFESLGVDSLDMVEMTCDLEENLGINLGEPEGIATINDLVGYIENL